MNIPKDLKYTKTHEWVSVGQDGNARIGITEFAQQQLGDIVYVNLPECGDAFSAGDVFADVESVKTAEDIYAPVSGKVTAVNEKLTESPELVNENAFNAWFVEMADVDAPAGLLSAEEYEKLLAEEA